MDNVKKVAVLGGTGNLGYGIALRLAKAGYDVVIGSRDQEKSREAAARIGQALSQATVHGAVSADAVRNADIVFLSVPFAAQEATLLPLKDALRGKILVDTTVPLQPHNVRTVHLPPSGSAAERAAQLLGEGVKVVSAFQNVSAIHLSELDKPVDCDVLVTGDDEVARAEVVGLIDAMGLRGIHAGVLKNAAAVESLTPVLLFINRFYKSKGAGVRVTNIAAPTAKAQ